MSDNRASEYGQVVLYELGHALEILTQKMGEMSHFGCSLLWLPSAIFVKIRSPLLE